MDAAPCVKAPPSKGERGSTNRKTPEAWQGRRIAPRRNRPSMDNQERAKPGWRYANRTDGFPVRATGWTASSRKRPCPLCGRDSDDKCRRRVDQLTLEAIQ